MGGAGMLLQLACLEFILECFLKLGCVHWFTLMFVNCAQQHQQLPCYQTCCYHNETTRDLSSSFLQDCNLAALEMARHSVSSAATHWTPHSDCCLN